VFFQALDQRADKGGDGAIPVLGQRKGKVEEVLKGETRGFGQFL
jgi:hypothetical protein